MTHVFTWSTCLHRSHVDHFLVKSSQLFASPRPSSLRPEVVHVDLLFTAQSCTVSSSITQRILHIGAAEAANSTSSCHELEVVVSGVSSSSVSTSESPRANLQSVSSEDHRTPVRGQAVEQSPEMRSALEFFATAQSYREGCQAYKNEVYLLPTELD